MVARFSIFFLLLLSCCTHTSPPKSQKATLSLSSDPTILDPRRARDLDSITILHMLFEGLTRASKSGQTELALAESVELSEDGCRYLFHLRKSFWSNGDPLTARDFELSWKTILSPHFATDISYQLYPIKNGAKAKKGEVEIESVGVRALDDYTLIVDLEHPVPYFLELVSMTSFYPVNANTLSENADPFLQAETWVSNGPFCLKEWKHSDHLVLEKNNRYWETNSVHLSSVDFVVAAPDTAFQMYEEGKLDWTGSPLSVIPPDAIGNLIRENILQASPSLATYFYRVNTSPAIGLKKNPLADPKVRKALAGAIDRDSIVEYVLKGKENPAYRLVPPEMGLSGKDHFFDQTLASLKELRDPITISYSNADRNILIAQAIQKQWENTFGIQVHLEAVEAKTFFQRIAKKEYQIAAGSWFADFNDPINFLEVFKYRDSGTNNTGWENPEYIDLLNRSSICMSREERYKILSRAEEILMDEMPVIPLFHFVMNYLKKAELKGVALSPLGQIDLRWAYFEPKSEAKESL